MHKLVMRFLQIQKLMIHESKHCQVHLSTNPSLAAPVLHCICYRIVELLGSGLLLFGS
ncbi:hypothetical protein [Clostridium sp.]|jgi:hypothetical protein|uniref:hypothetical protein n=1 Tax=Clostridium sp. TaxID=1506 RepID=UPI003EEF407B